MFIPLDQLFLSSVDWLQRLYVDVLPIAFPPRAPIASHLTSSPSGTQEPSPESGKIPLRRTNLYRSDAMKFSPFLALALAGVSVAQSIGIRKPRPGASLDRGTPVPVTIQTPVRNSPSRNSSPFLSFPSHAFPSLPLFFLFSSSLSLFYFFRSVGTQHGVDGFAPAPSPIQSNQGFQLAVKIV